MSEKLLESLRGVSGRRGFLGRITAGAVGLIVSLMGFTQPVLACCCHLCKPPSSSCPDCFCWWEWTCCETGSSLVRICAECYTQLGLCDATCPGVKCSFTELMSPPTPC